MGMIRLKAFRPLKQFAAKTVTFDQQKAMVDSFGVEEAESIGGICQIVVLEWARVCLNPWSYKNQFSAKPTDPKRVGRFWNDNAGIAKRLVRFDAPFQQAVASSGVFAAVKQAANNFNLKISATPALARDASLALACSRRVGELRAPVYGDDKSKIGTYMCCFRYSDVGQVGDSEDGHAVGFAHDYAQRLLYFFDPNVGEYAIQPENAERFFATYLGILGRLWTPQAAVTFRLFSSLPAHVVSPNRTGE